MAVNLNPANLAAFNNFMKQVGVATDAESPKGKKVTIEEAKTLQTEFDKLPNAEVKKAVAEQLLNLIHSDAFEVPSQGAKDIIAKVIGQPTDKVFTAREKAQVVGGSSIKTLADLAMGMLQKPQNIDKATMEKVTKAVGELPKEVKNFFYAAFSNVAKDGDVKMPQEARSVFTKGYAKAEGESGGAVSKMSASMSEPADGAMAYFSAQMANSPYFEDRLAALMFMVCAKAMKDVDESLRGLDDTIKNDVKGRDTKADQKKAQQNKPASSSTATGQLGQINHGEKGGPQSTTGQARKSFEAVVSSATSARADGVITTEEASKLATKLDGITPPEAKKLQAEAMGRAILAVGGGQMTDEMKPLADWVEKTTGKKLTDLGDAKHLYEATTPLAQTIGGSDKLENKVAAFILEGVMGAGKGPKLKEVMGEMKPLFQAMEAQVTGTTVEAEKAAAPKTSQHSQDVQDRFERLANAVKGGKIPEGQLEKAAAGMVERLPLPGADKKAVFDGVVAGLKELAKNKDADSKTVFGAAVAPLIATVKTPETEAIIGGAVDAIRNKVAEKAFNAQDTGKKMSPTEITAMLDKELGGAKAALLEQGKAAGMSPEHLNALGVAFDAEAKGCHDEVKKTGTIKSTEPRGQGTDHADPMETDESRSRQVMFEKVKLQMNRLSEMMQAMSNVLNTLHQTAENAIRAIR